MIGAAAPMSRRLAANSVAIHAAIHDAHAVAGA